MHTGAPPHPSRQPGSVTLTQRAADVHLLDRLRALLRYRWIALSVFVVVLIGAGLHTYSETPLYRAGARILIELEDERSLAVEGVGSVTNSEYSLDPEPYFQTQYPHPHRPRAGPAGGQHAGSRRRCPNSTARRRPTKGVWWLRDRLRAFAGRQLRWLRGAPEPLPPAPGALADESAADLITSRVSVAPVKASRLVDVYFVSADARTAAIVANALVDEYVRQNLELRQQSMGKSLEWLVEELARQQHTVESSERAMAEYRAAQQTTSLSDPQNIVTSRLNQLNDAATRARTIRAQKESLLRQIETLGAGAADSIPAISANTYIQSIKGRLAELAAPARAADRALRRQASGDGQHRRVDPGRHAPAGRGDRKGGGHHPPRIRIGGARRAHAGQGAVRPAVGRHRSRSPRRGLHDAGASGGQQPPALRDPAAARKGAAGAGQQPRQQRAHCRACHHARARRQHRTWRAA